MQAHLKCKLRLLALELVTSLRDVTLNVGSFNNYNMMIPWEKRHTACVSAQKCGHVTLYKER